MRAAYDEALRTVLEIPSVENEISGAQRMTRCLFKPSFHPECAFSFVERDGVVRLTIRVPAHPVWSFLNARHGGTTAEPVTDWVKPALSMEQIVLPHESTASWRGAINSVEQRALREGPAFGIDGMSVDVFSWHAGSEKAFSCWFGLFDEGDDRHQFVRSMLDTAIHVARWDQSIAALKNVRGYLGTCATTDILHTPA